jgi:hypothetical protein
MPYGAMWRQHRRTFHKYFNNNNAQLYHPIVYEENKEFLRRIGSQPNDIFKHLELYVLRFSIFTALLTNLQKQHVWNGTYAHCIWVR